MESYPYVHPFNSSMLSLMILCITIVLKEGKTTLQYLEVHLVCGVLVGTQFHTYSRFGQTMPTYFCSLPCGSQEVTMFNLQILKTNLQKSQSKNEGGGLSLMFCLHVLQRGLSSWILEFVDTLESLIIALRPNC